MATPTGSPLSAQKLSYVIAKTPSSSVAIKNVPGMISKIKTVDVWAEFENLTIVGHSKIEKTSFLKTKPLSTSQAGQLGYEFIKEGKPGHGTIFIYGQVHRPARVKLSEHDWADRVVYSQLAILDELIERGIKHIFVEGLDEDFPPDHPALKEQRSFLKRMYADHKAGEPALKQHIVKGCLGVHIYQCLNSDVFLYKTITPELMAKHTQEEKAATNFGSLAAILIGQSPEREKSAITFILEFLKKSKGIDVALNFGAGHKAADFAQYCDSECSPTIFSKKMDKQ